VSDPFSFQPPPNRSGRMHARHFTVAEANALLPDLRRALDLLGEFARDLRGARAELATLTPKMRGNGSGLRASELEGRITTLTSDLRHGLAAIAAMGIEVKRIEDPLIDFPSMREGREVYLCWRPEESEITYWHEIADGFAGRRRI